jgi:hypothetical protein
VKIVEALVDLVEALIDLREALLYPIESRRMTSEFRAAGSGLQYRRRLPFAHHDESRLEGSK